MKHYYTDEQIKNAATILMNNGISLYALGNFDISTPDDAVLFAQNSEEFYKNIESKSQDKILRAIERKAKELNVSTDEYLYYLKYSDPSLYKETGASDADLYGGRCVALTSKGDQCKNFVRFNGKFQEFKKDISDKCSCHRKKK